MAAVGADLPWLETVPGGRDGAEGSVRDPDGCVHSTLDVTSGDWILVRPDGYLSARGSGGDELRDAFGRLRFLHAPVPVGG